MGFSQCKYCNSLYNSVGDAKVCPKCRTILDEAYLKIRNYLYKNPENNNMVVVSEDLEISEKTISFLIDEGKLEFAGMGGKMRCKVCGAPCDGVLCSKCKGSFVSETKSLSAELEENAKKKTLNEQDKRTKFHHIRH